MDWNKTTGTKALYLEVEGGVGGGHFSVYGLVFIFLGSW